MLTHARHECHQPSCVRSGEPLADKTWFGTGGTAEWYAEPHTHTDIQELIAWAHAYALPLTCIGDGANILVSDAGIKGLVVRPAYKEFSYSDGSDSSVLVTCGAGMLFDDVIVACLDHDITGLEEFSGIPGRVGGCVYMNIHYFSHLLDHFIVGGTVIHKRTGIVSSVDHAWFAFGYDYSRLHEGEYLLLNVTFKLKRSSSHDVAYARGRHAEIIRHRKQRYPYRGTCGSFFRNFFDHEVTFTSNGKLMIFVAYYLDKLGIKGALSHGKAGVSYQHANMIVTQPGATTGDVIAVARSMQEQVYAAFGIIPQPECQLLGFDRYPLLD